MRRTIKDWLAEGDGSGLACPIWPKPILFWTTEGRRSTGKAKDRELKQLARGKGRRIAARASKDGSDDGRRKGHTKIWPDSRWSVGDARMGRDP